jgi:hypothetical protein
VNELLSDNRERQMDAIEVVKDWDGGWERTFLVRNVKNDHQHLVYVNYDAFYADCDCDAFTYSEKGTKSCKHIRYILSNFPSPTEVIDMENIRKRFLSSSVLGINSLIGGYIPKVPYGIYGPPAAGKSILSLFEGYAIANQESEREGTKKAILYYDTEGDGDILQAFWQEALEAKFGPQKFVYMHTGIDLRGETDPDKKLKLPVKVCRDWGVDTLIRKEIGQGGVFKGKIRFEYQGDVESTVEKAIVENNVGVIIIDSCTEPIDVFPGGNMNFPARANAIKYWFGQIQMFAKGYDLIVLGLHHASKNPTAGTYDKEQMIGGDTLLYKFKVLMCLERVGNSKIRKMRLTRYFNKEEWDEEVRLKLTNDGWVDDKAPPSIKPPVPVFG